MRDFDFDSDKINLLSFKDPERARKLVADALRDAERKQGKPKTPPDTDEYHLLDVSGVQFAPIDPAELLKSHGRTEADMATREEKPVTASRTAAEAPKPAAPAADVPQPQVAPLIAGSSAERLLAAAVIGEYSYGKWGLVLGLSAIIGGCILGLNGVAGSTSWTASFLGLQSDINDAAPGVVLFVVGVFMLLVTRPKIRMKDLRG
jgi:hypothetical protein